MKYERFEDLPVWQLAAALGAEVFDWTEHPAFRGRGDLANQLQRATLSISNNIAEGFERGSTDELLAFLYYARGSAGEVRSMLGVLQQAASLAVLRDKATELTPRFASVSRQLRGWANSLQNSDIKGPRHLNDATRREYDIQQRRAAFLESQREFRQAHKERLERAARERAEQQSRERAEFSGEA
ncbi:four helix bundle protein [Roseimaritima ulvae]|uniref:Four helix bundle protein n=1 Tax=Roseimaritima ulvae TaxID=980254 RepID=A0A5B9QHY4_9BACT|nr:four helix bundle protein [Roseimaritima ulvae]QEG38464.1 hypothetical protein UC8_04210 [Roseimaritima ulvae]